MFRRKVSGRNSSPAIAMWVAQLIGAFATNLLPIATTFVTRMVGA